MYGCRSKTMEKQKSLAREGADKRVFPGFGNSKR